MGKRNSKPKSQRLTPKMRIFADHLAAGHSQREAGVAAGYAENPGHLSNLSRHPAVTKHIESEARRRNIAQRLTLDWWVSSVLRLAMDAERDGDRTSQLGALRLAASYLHVDGRADSPAEDSFVAWLGAAAARALAADRGGAVGAVDPVGAVGVVDAAARVLPVGDGGS